MLRPIYPDSHRRYSTQVRNATSKTKVWKMEAVSATTVSTRDFHLLMLGILLLITLRRHHVRGEWAVFIHCGGAPPPNSRVGCAVCRGLRPSLVSNCGRGGTAMARRIGARAASIATRTRTFAPPGGNRYMSCLSLPFSLPHLPLPVLWYPLQRFTSVPTAMQHSLLLTILCSHVVKGRQLQGRRILRAAPVLPPQWKWGHVRPLFLSLSLSVFLPCPVSSWSKSSL